MTALDQLDDPEETRPHLEALVAQILEPITRVAQAVRAAPLRGYRIISVRLSPEVQSIIDAWAGIPIVWEEYRRDAT